MTKQKLELTRIDKENLPGLVPGIQQNVESSAFYR
jgi:hypothetical protein